MVTGLAPRGTVVEWNFRRSTSTSDGTTRPSTTSKDPARRTRFDSVLRTQTSWSRVRWCADRFGEQVIGRGGLEDPSDVRGHMHQPKLHPPLVNAMLVRHDREPRRAVHERDRLEVQDDVTAADHRDCLIQHGGRGAVESAGETEMGGAVQPLELDGEGVRGPHARLTSWRCIPPTGSECWAPTVRPRDSAAEPGLWARSAKVMRHPPERSIGREGYSGMTTSACDSVAP